MADSRKVSIPLHVIERFVRQSPSARDIVSVDTTLHHLANRNPPLGQPEPLFRDFYVTFTENKRWKVMFQIMPSGIDVLSIDRVNSR